MDRLVDGPDGSTRVGLTGSTEVQGSSPTPKPGATGRCRITSPVSRAR